MEEKKKKDNPWLYRFIRPLAYGLMMFIYHPRIEGKEYIPTEGRCVIAGNHKHALDPILVDASTRRTVHTLAKKDLHDSALGWFFRALGTIPVDLRAAHNKAALDAAVEYLERGNLINLSPEGKRNFTDEILLPFKYGAVVMAKRTNCKVVPYAIVGDYKFRSKTLRIIYSEPMDFSQNTIEEANALLYERIKGLLLQHGNYSKQQ